MTKRFLFASLSLLALAPMIAFAQASEHQITSSTKVLPVDAALTTITINEDYEFTMPAGVTGAPQGFRFCQSSIGGFKVEAAGANITGFTLNNTDANTCAYYTAQYSTSANKWLFGVGIVSHNPPRLRKNLFELTSAEP